MSVEVELKGRQFGNALFRYIHARIFAEINNLKLQTIFPYDNFVEISTQNSGEVYDNPIILHRDNGVNILSKKTAQNIGKHIFIEGNWENNDYYTKYCNFIKTIVKPRNKIVEVNDSDIVIHLRLGDFPCDKQIHPSWYVDILKNEKFDKLYVVTDLSNIDPSPISKPFLCYAEYLSYLSEFNPVVIGSDMVSDWDFIRKFSKIIMSNGTYCWWAVFFSECSKAYAFSRWHLSNFPKFTVVDGKYNGEM